MRHLKLTLFVVLTFVVVQGAMAQKGTRIGIAMLPQYTHNSIDNIESPNLPAQFVYVESVNGYTFGLNALMGINKNFSINTGANWSKHRLTVSVLENTRTSFSPIRYNIFEIPLTFNYRKALFPCSDIFLKTSAGTTIDIVQSSGEAIATSTYVPEISQNGVTTYPEYMAQVTPIKPPTPNLLLGVGLEIDMDDRGLLDFGLRWKYHFKGTTNLSIAYDEEENNKEDFAVGRSSFVLVDIKYYLPSFKMLTARNY